METKGMKIMSAITSAPEHSNTSKKRFTQVFHSFAELGAAMGIVRKDEVPEVTAEAAVS